MNGVRILKDLGKLPGDRTAEDRGEGEICSFRAPLAIAELSTCPVHPTAADEVWLDASDRVVRLHSTLPTEDPIEFVATYSGWGRQSVTLPARAETATLPYTFR